MWFRSAACGIGSGGWFVKEHEIQVIRSARKSISLEIRPDLQILVRAPHRMTDREIRRFLADKSGWLEKHLAEAVRRREELGNRPVEPKRTAEELRALAAEAAQVIPERVRYFAPIVGVDYGRITIRHQKTRWGSCSGKGNLNFNCLLMKTPPEVVDYVVVHELCHRKEMNHSPKFWAEVGRVLPEYKRARSWLKQNGSAII